MFILHRDTDAIEHCSQSSFPVMQKVGNVGIFVQLPNENKLEVVTSGININANYMCHDALN